MTSHPVGGAVFWTVLDTIAALRDAITAEVLGPRCWCGLRVFPRDEANHEHRDRT
jgi:hypothetical protein